MLTWQYIHNLNWMIQLCGLVPCIGGNVLERELGSLSNILRVVYYKARVPAISLTASSISISYTVLLL